MWYRCADRGGGGGGGGGGGVGAGASHNACLHTDSLFFDDAFELYQECNSFFKY